MFGMGVQEIIIIAIVLIIVVGPDDLPGLLRTVGRWIGSIQGMARDFRRQIDTMADDAGFAEERKLFDQARNLNPTKMLKDAIDPSGEIEKDLKDTNREVEEASLATRAQTSGNQDLWMPDAMKSDAADTNQTAPKKAKTTAKKKTTSSPSPKAPKKGTKK